MKIKITKEIKELNGIVVEKVVTPSGNSSHIPFAKQHTGKIVNVVVPDDPKYAWVLTANERDGIVNICKKHLSKRKETKMTFFNRQALMNILMSDFEKEDLEKVIVLLSDAGEKKLALKLKTTYNL